MIGTDLVSMGCYLKRPQLLFNSFDEMKTAVNVSMGCYLKRPQLHFADKLFESGVIESFNGLLPQTPSATIGENKNAKRNHGFNGLLPQTPSATKR